MSYLRTSAARRLSTTSRSLIFPTKITNMKEAIVHKGPKVEIVDSPIPSPGLDQVITKVVVSGSNPKDWKRAEYSGQSLNQGDDIAGVVHTVGSDVVEFKPGDRVAAFHQMMSPGGSYAEYAVSFAHTTFHIPKKTSFEGKIPVNAWAYADKSLTLWRRSCNYPLGCNDRRIRSLPTS